MDAAINKGHRSKAMMQRYIHFSTDKISLFNESKSLFILFPSCSCTKRSRDYGFSSSEPPSLSFFLLMPILFVSHCHTLRRMTGKEDGVSFTELEALQSQLKDVQLIVRDLKVMMLQKLKTSLSCCNNTLPFSCCRRRLS